MKTLELVAGPVQIEISTTTGCDKITLRKSGDKITAQLEPADVKAIVGFLSEPAAITAPANALRPGDSIRIECTCSDKECDRHMNVERREDDLEVEWGGWNLILTPKNARRLGEFLIRA